MNVFGCLDGTFDEGSTLFACCSGNDDGSGAVIVDVVRRWYCLWFGHDSREDPTERKRTGRCAYCINLLRYGQSILSSAAAWIPIATFGHLFVPGSFSV